MTSLLDESILAANEADISVPIFVVVNPDGSVGLNVLSLQGNALQGNKNPRYWGVYSYRLFNIGDSIIPQSNFQNQDSIDLVATDASIAPHDPVIVWRGVSRATQNPLGNYFSIQGAPIIALDTSGAVEQVPVDGNWHAIPTLTAGIIAPWTGSYRINFGAAQVAILAGGEVAIGFEVNSGGVLNPIAIISGTNGDYGLGGFGGIPINLNKGDTILPLQLQTAAGMGTVYPWISLEPIFIRNIQ